MTASYRIPIEGMTCTSCVGRISRALRRLDGVTSVHVDLGEDAATVGVAADRTSLEAVGAAVAQAGYTARLDEAVVVAERPRRRHLARLGR